jgi:hypothetical protein
VTANPDQTIGPDFPGQHLGDKLPVLAAGRTPRIDPRDWLFMLRLIGAKGYAAVLNYSIDRAVRHRDRLHRSTLGAGYEYVFSDF